MERFLDYIGLARYTEKIQKDTAKILEFSISVLPENWIGNSQTIESENFKSDSNYAYLTSVSYSEDSVSYGIAMEDVIINGQAIIHCRKTPTEIIVLNILRLEMI